MERGLNATLNEVDNLRNTVSSKELQVSELQVCYLFAKT